MQHLIAATGTFKAEHNRIRSLIRTSEQVFQSSSQAALDKQNQAIADTVNLLIRKAALDKVSWDIYALIRAGSIVLVGHYHPKAGLLDSLCNGIKPSSVKNGANVFT